MKSIDLSKENPVLSEIIDRIENESILILAPNGQSYILTEADDFEKEVEILRSSVKFQSFLDNRMKGTHRISIEEIEKELKMG